MPTKFSQFNAGVAPITGDVIVGLRAGNNTRFTFTAGGLPWQSIAGGAVLEADNGYTVSNGVPATLLLPAVIAYSQQIQIVNVGNSTILIRQNAGQQILFGNLLTTVGIGGSIQSIAPGDHCTLLCVNPNLSFVAIAKDGNWTII